MSFDSSCSSNCYKKYAKNDGQMQKKGVKTGAKKSCAEASFNRNESIIEPQNRDCLTDV